MPNFAPEGGMIFGIIAQQTNLPSAPEGNTISIFQGVQYENIVPNKRLPMSLLNDMQKHEKLMENSVHPEHYSWSTFSNGEPLEPDLRL